ncbi:hypothetical protein FA13DRAFT_194466 [Coprinellus micaceus]|uniref:Uncharacterized protein n=1 Tax=Coprinellus micaceus TaxID=71717 RepID=A0A4Y7TGB3_COPMI|nr:hypothetical protein FA13DRAFT_194466 [Coprinellus micaceus]
MDAGEALDISPLIAFRNLVVLHISTTQAIQFRQQEAIRISQEWRTLAIFDLNGTQPCRSTPLVDHTHVLAILRGCRLLQHLGLHFDTSHIPANSRADTEAPFQLGTLRVGDSPIYSPPQSPGIFQSELLSTPHTRALRLHERTTFNVRATMERRQTGLVSIHEHPGVRGSAVERKSSLGAGEELPTPNAQRY